MSCSVCASNSDSMGGVYLFERNGMISLICDDCWKTFSLVGSSRVTKNVAQQAALCANIGVESQLFYLPLPKSQTLQQSFVTLKKKYRVQPNPILS